MDMKPFKDLHAFAREDCPLKVEGFHDVAPL
jgi:hypothetical protein